MRSMAESSAVFAPSSNFRGDKFVTQKIRPADKRISFRELARFAYGKHADVQLGIATDKNPRTVKRWFAKRSRAPANALQVVLGEIIRKLE